jgi:UDP-N-acetylmuramate-alanine ligase
MMSENRAKIYIIEIKIVSLSSLARVMKKRGIKK